MFKLEPTYVKIIQNVGKMVSQSVKTILKLTKIARACVENKPKPVNKIQTWVKLAKKNQFCSKLCNNCTNVAQNYMKHC